MGFGVRQRYVPDRDEWVFESSSRLALTPGQMKAAAHNAAAIQADRARGMTPGDRRDLVVKSHEALRAGRFRQGFLGVKGDVILHSS